jgi:hypothetical protein
MSSVTESSSRRQSSVSQTNDKTTGAIFKGWTQINANKKDKRRISLRYS